MKKITFLITLLVSTFFSIKAFAAQNITIQNHSFGVITEDFDNHPVDDDEKLIAFFKNERCIATYKIAVGGIIIGEGETDFSERPQTIQLGKAKFLVKCEIQGDLTFERK